MRKMSILQKKINQLAQPYKKSKEYEAYGILKKDTEKSSSFWSADVEMIEKYEGSKIIK